MNMTYKLTVLLKYIITTATKKGRLNKEPQPSS